MSSENRISPAVRASVAREIINGLEGLISEAREETRPLELDPYRSRLFELFVTADGARLIPEDSERSAAALEDGSDADETDLSADGICRTLAQRWGLDMAAREVVGQQSGLPAGRVEQMRLLWSVMRMWMEWTYAWSRWDEFHREE